MGFIQKLEIDPFSVFQDHAKNLTDIKIAERQFTKHAKAQKIVQKYFSFKTDFLDTCDIVETGSVKYSREHFQTNNGVNNNDKKHKKSNMKERNHRHQDSVYDNLQA